ncbi:MAG TPA: M50 family metallopeptidase [Chloroflexota bacterium]|jgi:hypothetical protein|nr:M50 family metallopeptidase [Chloroflexota bacterium]
MQRVGQPQGRAASIDVRTVLVVALVFSVLLWLIPGASLLLLPIHPYLTFVHEGWHALVAVLTGGHVSNVHIFGVNGGGVTGISGGATLLIASAGYVGSAVTGATFLALLARPHWLRLAALVQYLWLALVALLWDHDINAWLYLLFFGVVLTVLARRVPERWFAIVMGFLALQLNLAVLGDLRTLLVLSAFSSAHSDALLAASVSHVPSLIWALVWTIMSALLLVWSMRYALGHGRTRRAVIRA